MLSLADMKLKMQHLDIEAQLDVVNKSLQSEVGKLEREKKAQQVELLLAQNEAEEASQKCKDLEKELRRSKHIWESASSKLSSELNKAKEELRKAKTCQNRSRQSCRQLRMSASRLTIELISVSKS